MENINLKIKEQISYEIIEELDDSKLLNIYKQTPSVKKQIEILSNLLENM